MAASSDVSYAKTDGPGNNKLHPYFISFVRWCISCVWGTATVVLHRLLTNSLPLPALKASRLPPKRPPDYSHLNHEPLVECEVLYQPKVVDFDVIFVHGLYGSLANTWRQGEWSRKYNVKPKTVTLGTITEDTSSSCKCNKDNKERDDEEEAFYTICNLQNDVYANMDDDIYNKLRGFVTNNNNNIFVTNNIYDKSLLDHIQILDNRDLQAKFVKDLFECKNYNNCDNKSLNSVVDDDDFKDDCNYRIDVCESEFNCNNNDSVHYDSNNSNRIEEDISVCDCESDERSCEAGCGCVCDDCYSHCWPKDWIRMDYPNARIISINYTSDPHLWRPLWIKESKRLRLHERAEQMIEQLLELGVGEKPTIWVGHSKGGLFIKQIYCEGYEAHRKLNKTKMKTENDTNINSDDDDARSYDDCVDFNENTNVDSNGDTLDPAESNEEYDVNGDDRSDDEAKEVRVFDNVVEGDGRECASSLKLTEDELTLSTRASLWRNSVGFMFYSVPHRGSPLADIKTPITTRSVELLEMGKDCELVLSLQDRWSSATRASGTPPAVRSLVETTRTLMSLLWLRIVTVHSADAGIGSLRGVSVDHREICKPTSRRCLLYQELMTLMRTALNKCRCHLDEI